MNKTVARIQELTESTGITVRELADVAGCSKSAMQRYMAGERDIPTNIITGIAKAFNVHPAYLFGWVDDKHYEPNKQKQPTNGELSIRKREFMQKVAKMSDDQLARLEQILDLVEAKD